MSSWRQAAPAAPNAGSMRDVARMAGVSLSSVSLVAADHPGVGDETRAPHPGRDAAAGLQSAPTAAPRSGALTLAIISERLIEPIERDIFYAEIPAGHPDGGAAPGPPCAVASAAAQRSGAPRWMSASAMRWMGMILANGGDLTDALIVRLANSRVPACCRHYVIDQPLQLRGPTM